MLDEIKNDDWKLPFLGITADREELLLIDWIICNASKLVPDAFIPELTPLRYDVWKNLAIMEETSKSDIQFTLSISDADFLLICTPTTFRFGTGVDCGFYLKKKLAKFLRSNK